MDTHQAVLDLGPQPDGSRFCFRTWLHDPATLETFNCLLPLMVTISIQATVHARLPASMCLSLCSSPQFTAACLKHSFSQG